jgi:two-component system, sensor histidine kinase RegB
MLTVDSRLRAPEARLLRLDTLVKLRWMAVAGQLAAVLIVVFGFNFPLPLPAALGIIAVSTLLNLALRINYPLIHRLPETSAATLLAYDVVQLAALLYLTGGLENPFAFLFLAPVMISATALKPHHTMGLGALVMAAATLLAFWHLPLPWIPGETMRLPPLYVAGVWLSIFLGLTFIGVYAWRVAEEARQLGEALAATELVLAREQHLSQLDGLAAAAAHELGTPLSTIALVVRELQRDLPENGPHGEDIMLLQEQVARCRTILSKIATLGSEPEDPLKTVTIRQLVEEISAPQRPFGVKINTGISGADPQPQTLRRPGLFYGLENMIDNAVDFATSTVHVEAYWSISKVMITIRDDGPGFAPEVLRRLGDPYVTTRRLGERANEIGGGLGLGLFIAKTLLERTGATFEAQNRIDETTGAEIRCIWPRDVFEIGPPPPYNNSSDTKAGIAHPVVTE